MISQEQESHCKMDFEVLIIRGGRSEEGIEVESKDIAQYEVSKS